MNLHKLRGVGLGNVWLTTGVSFRGEGDKKAAVYADLDGLLLCIARAVALTSGDMSCEELRFLRKRLKWTQQQLANMVDKVDQTVAKWEKGLADVPRADANLVRLAWLERHSRRDLAHAVKRMTTAQSSIPCHTYVFHFDGSQWHQDETTASLITFIAAHQQTRALVQGFTLAKRVTNIESGSTMQMVGLTQPQGSANDYVVTTSI